MAVKSFKGQSHNSERIGIHVIASKSSSLLFSSFPPSVYLHACPTTISVLLIFVFTAFIVKLSSVMKIVNSDNYFDCCFSLTLSDPISSVSTGDLEEQA